MELTRKQLIWLNQQGGRDINDVVSYNGEPFIMMYSPRLKEKAIYVPPNARLELKKRRVGGTDESPKYWEYVVLR